jgi:eukaryotic-like serine/threonine-protein kinase
VAKIRRDPSDMQSDTAGLTQTGSMLGSPLYMSPEQARSTKNVDHRTDLWSMGVVLYQAIAGRTPYEHISGLGDLILALCSDLPPPVQQFAPWVEPDVAALVDRALRVDVRERFQTADEMLAAIKAIVPDGIEIRDDMMVPLDDATHEHAAPTFFRKITMPNPPVIHVPSLDVTPSGATPPPSSTDPAIEPRPSQNTHAAVATTGPGLGATQVVQRPSSLPMVAIILASVLVGGAGVYAITRPSEGAIKPVNAMGGAGATPTATAAKTVEVTPSATATAAPSATASATASASAAPSATAEPSASVAPVAPVAPVATTPRFAKPYVPAKPKPTATAKPTNPDPMGYGPRK